MKNHWVVIFRDVPEMLERRAQLFSEHISYLSSHKEIFVDGASLSQDEASEPQGGIWIIQASEIGEIVNLIENDPMYDSKLRSFEIFATKKLLKTRA